jgi:hypothetical protein
LIYVYYCDIIPWGVIYTPRGSYMAKATSSRESSSKAEVSVHSDSLPTNSQNGNIEKRARRANVARHTRKCTVCHHPEREFIDQDYLRWLSPKKIAHEYKISHHSAVYRHADATGLRAQRRASLRATLENFIEQAESVRATAGSVVAAVRLYAQINDQGQWTPPVRRHIVEYVSAHSSHTKNDPENSQERSSKGTPAAHTADPAATASVYKKDALPSSSTSAAQSAAPDAKCAGKLPGSLTFDATGSLQPVATITAGSVYPEWPAGLISKGEVPFSASPDKFPVVPVASINFAADLPISNRERVELEHAATR